MAAPNIIVIPAADVVGVEDQIVILAGRHNAMIDRLRRLRAGITAIAAQLDAIGQEMDVIGRSIQQLTQAAERERMRDRSRSRSR